MENYTFEMHDLRKSILKTISEECRENNEEGAKYKCLNIIRSHPDVKNKEKTIKHFKTSYHNALDIVRNRTNNKIKIEEAPKIINDHDGEIRPSEIEGEMESIIVSFQEKKFSGEKKTIYPVYMHKSGYRICSCPSQKYSIICKHTLSRVIERNLPESPI